jgi:hypothetical protein
MKIRHIFVTGVGHRRSSHKALFSLLQELLESFRPDRTVRTPVVCVFSDRAISAVSTARTAAPYRQDEVDMGG